MQVGPDGSAAVVEWPEHPALNAVVFRTDSDGLYPTYWGDDAAGRAVVLLTDFGLPLDRFSYNRANSSM